MSKKIELTIKVDYLPTWGMFEGLRELLQNARDAETEFDAPMTVRMRGDTLVIENEGATMPHESLLLGHTSKLARGDLIGKFGEGFKLGILALLRAGHSVKIRNGAEVWVPEICHSSRFHAKVLAFTIETGRQANNRIQIEVGGVGEAYETDIKPAFLWLDSDRRKDTSSDRVVTSYGTLLLSDVHKGRVYVKGIMVQTMPGLDYGYDLADADLDRDRRMVASYDFRYKARQIWTESMGRRPDLCEDFMALLESASPETEGIDGFDAKYLPESFLAHATATFRERYGENAVPVSSLADGHELEHFGKTGIVVNKSTLAVLESKLGNLQTVKESLRNEVIYTYSWHELNDSQKANLTRAIGLVNGVTPLALPDVTIVDYRSKGLLGTYTNGEIRLSYDVLASPKDTLATLVHEVAHRGGGDGEKGHVSQIEALWSGIVDHFVG